MSYPSSTTIRSYAGSAQPTYLASTLAATYTTGQTFTLGSASTWYELDFTGVLTTNPLGTSGPFVVDVDFGSATEEKILCSALNPSTGVVTVWTDGTLNGRGYDGTTAQAHSAGNGTNFNVFPVATATESLQFNKQIASNAYQISAEVTRAEGAESTLSTAISAETTRAEAAEATKLPLAGGTMSGAIAMGGNAITGGGEIVGTDHKATGLTGATAGARFVGATTNGAPTSGTFVTGDFIVDQYGKFWVCTASGTPGSWASAGNGTVGTTGAVTAAGSTQTSAGALAYNYNIVSGATATTNGGAGTGVELPYISATGQAVWVDNTDSTHWLKLYPSTGQSIDEAGANNPVWIAPKAYWLGIVETTGSSGNWASAVPSFNTDGNGRLSVTYSNGQITFGLSSVTGSGSTVVLQASPSIGTPSLDRPTIGLVSGSTPGYLQYQANTMGTYVQLQPTTAGSASTTYVLNIPSGQNDTFTLNAATQTLTNKTLTSPTISAILNGGGTLQLPTSNDTLVGQATSDTLTNKTINGSNNTITNISLSTGVTGSLPVANLAAGSVGQYIQTGPSGVGWAYGPVAATTTTSGLIQLAGDLSGTSTSPTVVSVAHVTTGTLPVANGGTNLTAVGSNGTVLTSNGSALSYVTPVATTPPALNGLKAWTYDAGTNTVATGGLTLATGTVYFMAVYLQAGVTYSNVYVITATGVGSSYVTVGLYSATTQLAVTGNIATTTTNTQASGSFGTAYTPTTSGVYWLGIITNSAAASHLFAFNQATAAAINVGPNTVAANTLNQRCSTLTVASLPTTISGTPAVSGSPIWVGLA